MEAKATSLPILLSVYACFGGYEVYTYNLKQSQESLQGTVEVDFCIHPAHAQGLVTLILILDYVPIKYLQGFVINASVEFPVKQLITNNTEDEPEDQAHQHHVHDRGNSVHQRIHDNLQRQHKKL